MSNLGTQKGGRSSSRPGRFARGEIPYVMSINNYHCSVLVSMTLLFFIVNFHGCVPRPIIMPYNIGFFQHRLTEHAAFEEYIPRDGRGFVVFMTVKYTE